MSLHTNNDLHILTGWVQKKLTNSLSIGALDSVSPHSDYDVSTAVVQRLMVIDSESSCAAHVSVSVMTETSFPASCSLWLPARHDLSSCVRQHTIGDIKAGRYCHTAKCSLNSLRDGAAFGNHALLTPITLHTCLKEKKTKKNSARFGQPTEPITCASDCHGNNVI